MIMTKWFLSLRRKKNQNQNQIAPIVVEILFHKPTRFSKPCRFVKKDYFTWHLFLSEFSELRLERKAGTDRKKRQIVCL